MDEICRLCCSTKFVNNDLFDEENALYLKMSLFLPIKVVRSERLPQRVCDRCSCRVNDLYQFCNETIEVQHRLRAILQSSGLPVHDIDLSLPHGTPGSCCPRGVSLAHSGPDGRCSRGVSLAHSGLDGRCSRGVSLAHSGLDGRCSRGTQTAPPPEPRAPPAAPPPVKEELPPELLPIKTEAPDDCDTYDDACHDGPPDDTEDASLINLKKKKKKTIKREIPNGVEVKKGRKRKKGLKEWDLLMTALPTGPALALVAPPPALVKPEPGDFAADVVVKREPDDDTFDCCICSAQCYSRGEMLQHYRQHGGVAEGPPPAPPPPPAARPLRCPRCSKVLEESLWASHWLRHWERDRRPYRCARCEKTFRDHHQVLKHGLTHKGEAAGAGAAPGKRFVCDLCPEGFVYMRYLLAHRTRAHPESAARALTLRCAECAREFAHLNSLRRHLRAHSGERNFLCSVCGKALSSREHLKFHLRIHAGYKPNVCKTCGKGFVKKCNLTLHERVHSGEKPHVCSHCGKAFSQRSTLVIHERYHSGARPYVCALCGRGFVAKGLLSMHLKTTCI